MSIRKQRAHGKARVISGFRIKVDRVLGMGIKYTAVGCSNPHSFGPKNSFPASIQVHMTISCHGSLGKEMRKSKSKKCKSSFSWPGFKVYESNCFKYMVLSLHEI